MDKLYPWLTQLWQEWQTSLEAGRFSNASMLIAEPGLGAEQLVDLFSRVVMCSNYDSEACGFCHSCQLMKSGSHPDFHIVKPEKEGKAITVEQIRHCNRQAQESSQLAGTRLFIIEPAEAMNESAANALLKTLEEPSGRCMFLLVTHRANGLLPTITSRCQQWHLASPDSKTVTDWLSIEAKGEIPVYAAHLNRNAPLSTLEFVEAGKTDVYLKLEAQLLDWVKGQGDALKLAKDIVAEPDALNWLWYLLTDAQKSHFGLDMSSFLPGSKPLAASVEYVALYQQSESLGHLIEQLREHSGLNGELLILDWLFKFNEETCS
ncbi:DNA polymerase III subunit delta' [Vibrio atypicus]|uniref:DNA polymerase III subunit delta' n=1 Tax=Vibrio atypicus TaxID=558271 RepID=UPI00135882C6|nr:DNA polymerase III subunit delta' [Vibrio atypicus]